MSDSVWGAGRPGAACARGKPRTMLVWVAALQSARIADAALQVPSCAATEPGWLRQRVRSWSVVVRSTQARLGGSVCFCTATRLLDNACCATACLLSSSATAPCPSTTQCRWCEAFPVGCSSRCARPRCLSLQPDNSADCTSAAPLAWSSSRWPPHSAWRRSAEAGGRCLAHCLTVLGGLLEYVGALAMAGAQATEAAARPRRSSALGDVVQVTAMQEELRKQASAEHHTFFVHKKELGVSA